MKKKVLMISAVSAAFAVSCGFAIQGHTRAAQYEQWLENSYTHAYYELTTAVSELDAALKKIQYSNTPVLFRVLCTDVYGKTVAAQMALSELPVSNQLLEQTASFLARTGDYACSLSRASTADSIQNEDNRAVLYALAEASSQLSASLLSLQSDLVNGGVSLRTVIHADQDSDTGAVEQGGTAFQSTVADFPQVPTLIYDGPFSEHLSNQTPLALDGLPSVSRDEARAAAAEILGLRPEVLTPIGESGGVLPTWGFSASVDGGELYIEMTQAGCKVLNLFTSRTAGDAAISTEDAIKIARDFLLSNGFGTMEESYHVQQGDILTINFAPKENDVLCYPDLVKVSVALDTGTVVGLESHGWIMNHTTRSFPEVTVDQHSASETLSPDLEILSHQLALIPTGGEYEVLCHEFKCRDTENNHILVYINAETGNEEQILLLLEDENGTLVW